MYELDKFIVFNVISINEELEEKFQEFFNVQELNALFTHENKTGQIRVTDNDLRSVVNKGKYHALFSKLSKYLKIASDNKAYDEAVFKLLDKADTFQQLANNARKVIQFIDDLQANYLYNSWNIVFYTKEVL